MSDYESPNEVIRYTFFLYVKLGMFLEKISRVSKSANTDTSRIVSWEGISEITFETVVW